MRRDDLLDLAIIVQDADLRRVAIANVGQRVLDGSVVGLVRHGIPFAVEFLAVQVFQRVAFQCSLQVQRCNTACVAGDRRLARAGGRTGVGALEAVGSAVDNLVSRQIQDLADVLAEDVGRALAHIGCADADDNLAVFDDQATTAPVGDAVAKAGVLHAAGDASRVSTRPVSSPTIWAFGRV